MTPVWSFNIALRTFFNETFKRAVSEWRRRRKISHSIEGKKGGGKYGEGALRIEGRTVGYYNTAAAYIGFQFGAQSKTVILMFNLTLEGSKISKIRK